MTNTADNAFITNKAEAPEEGTVTIQVTRDELALILEGLDSHRYYELSDMSYRDSGFVRDPGSDDPEKVQAIKNVDALELKLEKMRNA